MHWKVPLFDTDFGEAESQAVLGVLRSGWLTMGPAVEQLEAEFARQAGCRHAVAVANCTAGLHLALLAAGVRPGDEVIVPSLSFVATANAARYCGARVVFADVVGREDWNIDPHDVAARVTPRTRAVVVMHYAGFPCRMEALAQLAARHGLQLVEDCAHALFSKTGSRVCGTFGAAGAFSFFSNKNMTCGEGGMVTAQDDRVAAEVRLRRSHGMTSSTLDRHRGRAASYDVVAEGYNYRLDEVRSALALAQLRRLPGFLAARRQLYREYLRVLAEVPEVTVPFTDRPEDEEVGIHLFPVLLPPSADRGAVMASLKEQGVQASVHYPPIHRFTAYREFSDALPRTEEIAARELTLPFFPTMTAEQLALVIASLKRALWEQRLAG
jgi:dTDP-4-amino-4,6-dideoxygalactose transaminase